MTVLQRHLLVPATPTINVLAQMRELKHLRGLVRKAELSARKAQRRRRKK